MARIGSDDAYRKLRAVWLGPKGSTLPFEWTYVQWLVCILSAVVCGAVFLIVLGLAWAWVYGIAAAVMYGIPAGFYVGVKLMKGVSYDEPFGYRVRMVRDQLRRRPPVPAPLEWEVRLPPIGDLSPGASRAAPPKY